MKRKVIQFTNSNHFQQYKMTKVKLTFLGKRWSPTTISFSTLMRAFPGTTGYILRRENTRKSLGVESVVEFVSPAEFMLKNSAMWSIFGRERDLLHLTN